METLMKALPMETLLKALPMEHAMESAGSHPRE